MINLDNFNENLSFVKDKIDALFNLKIPQTIRDCQLVKNYFLFIKSFFFIENFSNRTRSN